MYNVIEFSSSVRVYSRIEEYSEVKVFEDLIDIFDEYIDVDYVKSWFGNGVDDIDVVLSDVLEWKNGVGVMSVNEDMSLYIFKNEGLCDLLESYVFDMMENV